MIVSPYGRERGYSMSVFTKESQINGHADAAVIVVRKDVYKRQ